MLHRFEIKPVKEFAAALSVFIRTETSRAENNTMGYYCQVVLTFQNEVLNWHAKKGHPILQV